MATKKPRKKVTGCVQDRMFRKMHSRLNARNNASIAEVQAINAATNRLNNLPLGHPDHKDRLMQTYTPMLRWLDEVEATEHMDVTKDGTAILHTPEHASDEKWFKLDAAFIAVADCFELIASDGNFKDEGRGLRQVGKKVEAGMMLFPSDFAAARHSIAWMIEETKRLTPLQIQEYTTVISIRAHMALNKIQSTGEVAA